MNCRTCGYPLWNLQARTCPECGAAFRVGDFQFVPGSTRFCCPHCDQPYYGTSALGHLVPDAFACVHCNHAVSMEEMVLRPVEGATAAASAVVDVMPWFERQQRGWFKAWTATLWRAMTRPESLMRAIPEDVSFTRAWSFMYVNNLVFSAIGSIIPMFVVLGGFGYFGARWGAPGLARLVTMQTLIQYAVVLVGYAVVPIVWAALAHVLLGMTGVPRAPLARTFHAIFYSAAARAGSAVPCLDSLGQIWWLVSSILMFKQAHRCGGGKASFAVIAAGVLTVVPVVCGVAFYPSYVMGGGMGYSAMAGASGPRVETAMMLAQLRAWAAASGEPAPPHAAFLMDGGAVFGPANFIAQNSLTREDAVPVGSCTLEELALMPEGRRQQAAREAADALPAGTVAHRLGDFVFTYHGIDLSRADARLLVVVLLPDPDANGAPGPRSMLQLGYADGRSERVRYDRLDGTLRAQNVIRQELGLARLPIPLDVTHARPAVAGAAPRGRGLEDDRKEQPGDTD